MATAQGDSFQFGGRRLQQQDAAGHLAQQPHPDLEHRPGDLPAIVGATEDKPALRQAGFDADRPTAWIAEGLLAFLPPEAQDRLLDNITALSAKGSRLAAEIFINSTDTAPDEDPLQTATQRWRDHRFDIELSELGYDGERNDVATYLNDHGWRSVTTPLRQLLADNGLPPVPTAPGQPSFANNYYCTATLHR